MSPLWWAVDAHVRRAEGTYRGLLPGSTAEVQDLTGGGDHFRAEVVSERFEGLSRIDRHRLVYDVFGDEVGGPIHALSLKTSTLEETT
jgi:Stress-induced morphogen (activity unknown)